MNETLDVGRRCLGAGLLGSALFLAGCATDTGVLTGETQPEWWVKVYCLETTGQVDAGASGIGGANAMGTIQSKGLVGLGEFSDEVLIELAAKECDELR